MSDWKIEHNDHSPSVILRHRRGGNLVELDFDGLLSMNGADGWLNAQMDAEALRALAAAAEGAANRMNPQEFVDQGVFFDALELASGGDGRQDVCVDKLAEALGLPVSVVKGWDRGENMSTVHKLALERYVQVATEAHEARVLTGEDARCWRCQSWAIVRERRPGGEVRCDECGHVYSAAVKGGEG